MSEDEGRTFLSRWSRRKIAARASRDEPGVAAPPAAEAALPAVVPEERTDASREAPELPDVETLKGLESEYRDFLHPEVDESLRRTALKKLFADPHFNAMDGLDIYIDDYSQPDPIPQAMLRTLNQARGLFLFDDEEKEKAAGEPGESGAATQQDGSEPAPGLAHGEDVPIQLEPTNCPDDAQMSTVADDPASEERKSG